MDSIACNVPRVKCITPNDHILDAAAIHLLSLASTSGAVAPTVTVFTGAIRHPSLRRTRGINRCILILILFHLTPTHLLSASASAGISPVLSYDSYDGSTGHWMTRRRFPLAPRARTRMRCI